MNSKVKLHLAQQEVYYEQIIDPKNPLYNIGGYAIFKGEFDVQTFKSIIESLHQVFDVFNIRFEFGQNEPSFFTRHLSEGVEMDEKDFSSNHNSKGEAEQWMNSQYNIAFDLQQEKLYRYTLIKIDEDEYWWFVCFHHLISDGFGFALKVDYIINEMNRRHKGIVDPEIKFPSYYDAALKSIEYLHSTQYEKDAAYWKEKYSEIPKPVLKSKQQKEEKVGKRYTIRVDKSERLLLNQLSKSTKANVSQFTIAALLIYFGKTTGQNVFSFGTPYILISLQSGYDMFHSPK